MRQLLDHAAEFSYGLPAFNVNNLEQMRAIMEAADKTNSPVIVQASAGAQICRCAVPAPPDSGGSGRISAYPGGDAPGPRHQPGNLPTLDPARF